MDSNCVVDKVVNKLPVKIKPVKYATILKIVQQSL